MALHNILILIHLIGISLLSVGIGSIVMVVLVSGRVETNQDAVNTIGWLLRISPVFGIASLLILGSGIWLGIRNDLFGEAWLIGSLLVFISTAITGNLIHSRRLVNAAKLAGEQPVGPISPEVRAALHDRVLRTSLFIDTCLFVALLFLMSSRPELVGVIITIVAAIVVGALLSLVLEPRSSVTAVSS